MQFVPVPFFTLCFLQKLICEFELYSISICQFDSKNGGQSTLYWQARKKCCFVLLRGTENPFFFCIWMKQYQGELSNFEQFLKHELSHESSLYTNNPKKHSFCSTFWLPFRLLFQQRKHRPKLLGIFPFHLEDGMHENLLVINLYPLNWYLFWIVQWKPPHQQIHSFPV